MNIDFRKEPGFEEVYPKAPFSELIRLTLVLAARLRKPALPPLRLHWLRSHRLLGRSGLTTLWR